MKKRNTLSFIGGIGVGLVVALCLGAGEKPKEASKEIPKPDWSQLKVVAYPNSGTGFFDPNTGNLYIYDGQLRNCYLTRRLVRLGDPLQ